MSAAASARAQRAQRRAAQSAPQPRRMPIHVQSAARPNREILSEHSSDDCYSECELVDATASPVVFPAAATSRVRAEAQMTPSAALLVAQRLADNEPRANLHNAWIEQIADLFNIAYPAAARSVAPPPPGAQPPPRPHQHAHRTTPRDQGAAAAPLPARTSLTCLFHRKHLQQSSCRRTIEELFDGRQD